MNIHHCPVCGESAQVSTVHSEYVANCTGCGDLDKWAEIHLPEAMQASQFTELDAVRQWNEIVEAYRVANTREAA